MLGVGTDLHMDYDAIGATVHLAARMEQIAPADAIRLTSDTAQLLRDRMSVNELGPTPVAGFSHPIEVFKLLGVTEVELGGDLAATTAEMIGRDAELQTFGDIARRVRGAGVRPLFLQATPGSAKPGSA